jgi:S-adenosylmethionine synthetase
VRKDKTLSYLRPDGKSQVTVEYQYGLPKRVDTIVLAAQHSPEVKQSQIRADLIDKVINHVVPADMLDAQTKIYVNATGRFVTGGPLGDAGVTGRKIIVDTYGGIARHGGGCFSGKDPTKVDRSASYMARYIAKNLVAAGVADRLELQVSYAIGVARPLALMVEAFRTGQIIRDLDLRRPIYKATAAYGHFGRDDIDAPWEKTDKADLLRRDAGLA